jgi:outer membrane protein assembly factor BamB
VDDLVVIGIKGTVLALDRATGGEVWRAKLKGSGFTNVVREGGALLAATHGELFCLDPHDGRILWHNPLRGMGFGIVSFASDAQQLAAVAQNHADDDAAASATTTSMPAS